MKAQVICCNDSVEHVLLSSKERAEEVMEGMARNYYEKNKWNWESYEDSRKQLYWHIREIPCTVMDEESGK